MTTGVLTNRLERPETVLGTLVMAIVTLAIMVFPGLATVVRPAYWAPMALFEFGLGFWLLIRGIRAPDVARSTGPSLSRASA